MSRRQEAPPLLARIEVAVANAMPVLGIVLLGWPVATVVVFYVLDGWFCILGLGASVMIRNRAEMRAMVPKAYGRARRFLFLVTVTGAVEAIASMFAIVPGVIVLAHLDASPARALGEVFGSVAVLVPVATLVASHVSRTVRLVRGSGEGSEALSPKLQMALFTYRMFLMMFLVGLASPGFLSRFLAPVYVAAVAAVFTYSDLYPRRFLARLMAVKGGALEDGEEDAGEAPADRQARGG